MKTRQKFSVVKHFENIDLDQIKLEVFDDTTDEILVELVWDAKDFFKQITDLQYDYSK